MKTVSMSGSLRENVGKKDAKALRNAEKVPCVIYGGEKQLHFAVPNKDFRHLVYSPDIAFVDLDIEGTKYKAILQDIQFHPVSDNILHADFKELVDGKKIIMAVPVKTNGLPVGVAEGGKLMVKLRKLKVKALPEFMPEAISVDVAHLNIGDSVKVKEISIDNAELLDTPNAVAVAVNMTRAAVAAEGEGVQGVEETEGGEAAESTEE
ncbi:MAG: 50S ribosomal protein L25 [Bacteroidetes bacterium]|nr:MAG: 50S ribosomal protein L25 [Bacteroidota bacterium]